MNGRQRCHHCGAAASCYQLAERFYVRCARCGRTAPTYRADWSLTLLAVTGAAIWGAIWYFSGGCL